MWEKVKLGDIATFLNGYAFKPQDWSNEGLEIIRIQNLTRSSSETNYYNGIIPERYKVTTGDILISWSATLGVYEWKDTDAWLNQHIFKVIFDKKEVNKSFFVHLIEYVLDDLKSQVHGATMKHITKKKFDGTLVPFPPLPVQEKIAAILDRTDELRRKDQELQDKYDELAQAIFIDMFGDPVRNEKGWEVKKLGELITQLRTGVSVNSTDKIPTSGDLCILKTSAVYTGYFDPLQKKVIVSNEIERAKLNPKKNSIIISRMNTRDLVCKSAYIKHDYPLLFLPDRLWQTVHSDVKHNILWLSFLLGLNAVLRKIQKKASGTSGSMKNISKKNYLSTEIIFPPLHLQEAFAKKIELINELKAKANAEKSEDLFQSLLQRAFKGDLVS